MKNLRLTIIVVLILMIFILGIKIFRNFNISRDLKNKEETPLKESTRVLKECFDLDNKSERSLNQSIKLIDYCLKKYGFEN